MLVDLIILILFLAVLFRGKEIGFIRQFCSTAGFIGGLLLGAAVIEPHVIHMAHTPLSRTMLTLVSTLGVGILLLSLGEYIGIVLKTRLQRFKIDLADVILGAIAGGVTLLMTIWLMAPMLVSLPFPGLQNAIRSSVIISSLDAHLPSAPNVIADLNHIINPNGFPTVFSGHEPTPPVNTSLPSLGSLQYAVTADEASVVKIEGNGCGGVVEGSGFVAADGLVITNAHVVAGVQAPYVLDSNGTHRATPIWFDPNLDIAILSVHDLVGKALTVSSDTASDGTNGAVLGYPGGGPFSVQPATIMDTFEAVGKNIYNEGSTTRNVYELKATVIPGNSGGPVVTADGTVIGVVFAESTTYNQVGYALVTKAVVTALHQAEQQPTPTTTGTCAAS